MATPKTQAVRILTGAAVGALIGIFLAVAYVGFLLPGQLTGHSPDSDAGFVLVLLGGFLAFHGSGAGVLVVVLRELFANRRLTQGEAGAKSRRVGPQLLLVVGALILVIGFPLLVIVLPLIGVHV
jgi:hypothetical protein